MITRTLSLNKLLMALLIFTALPTFAEENEICGAKAEILIRDKKEGYENVKRNLDDLFCENTFEGKYFKIVKGISDEAISIEDDDKALVRKAANVYYHLTLARNYWVNDIKSEYVKKIEQITIRLEITNAFSSVRHFKNEELEKNHNNAWTIPEGKEPSFLKKPKIWGKEIWFSPMKQINARDHITTTGNNPIHESLVLVKDPLIEYSKNSLIYLGLAYSVAPAINQSYLLETAVTNLGVLAIIYGSIEITKNMDKYFVEKYYYLDTAMIPEVIYHEYAHIAMSDHLKTVHSVPVIEGMADYFASRLANRQKMYEKMKDFSSSRSKDTKSKLLYSPYLEGAWNATSDFTLSLLWNGKKEFDLANTARLKKSQAALVDYDQLVFKAHNHLDETSDIANGLTKALIESCKESCTSLRAGVNTLNNVFEQKGMN